MTRRRAERIDGRTEFRIASVLTALILVCASLLACRQPQPPTAEVTAMPPRNAEVEPRRGAVIPRIPDGAPHAESVNHVAQVAPVTTVAVALGPAQADPLEMRLNDLARRIQGTDVPAGVFPDRYVLTDGLLEQGRRRADQILEGTLQEHWLAESQVSRLELRLWEDFQMDRTGAAAGSIHPSLRDLQVAAARAVKEYRRRPYRLVANTAATQQIEVRSEDTVETAFRRAVTAVIDEAAVPKSPGIVVYARAKLRPRVDAAFQLRAQERAAAREAVLEVLRRDTSGRVSAEQLKMVEAAFSAAESELQALSRSAKVDVTVEELVSRSPARQRELSDEAQSQELLLLAAAELHQSGIPPDAFDEQSLGGAWLASLGRVQEIKQALETRLERERLLKTAELEGLILARGDPARAAGEALQADLSKPQGVDALLYMDASRVWRQDVIRTLHGELASSVQKNATGAAQQKSLLEETQVVLDRFLQEMWLDAAFEAIKARLARISRLTAANLGNLTEFRSVPKAELEARVRNKLEQCLRTEGWSGPFLDNYFVLNALDIRSQQVAEVVKRVISKEGA